MGFYCIQLSFGLEVLVVPYVFRKLLKRSIRVLFIWRKKRRGSGFFVGGF